MAWPGCRHIDSLAAASADSSQATWVFVILGNIYDITTGKWSSSAHTLLSAQELWFAVFMTIL